MRGVHLSLARSEAELEGSSPHARGPLSEAGQLGEDARIIPACAGSTRKSMVPRR